MTLYLVCDTLKKIKVRFKKTKKHKMRKAKRKEPAFVSIESGAMAPNAKYFIDSLIRFLGRKDKEMDPTIAYFKNLIQKGLPFKMSHPKVRELLAEAIMDEDNGQSRLVMQAFVTATQQVNLSPKDDFLSCGKIYEGLRLVGGLHHRDEVVRVMEAIKPAGWISPEEHRKTRSYRVA